jgi:tetratricopeptide (TPR) repeat protein
MRAAVLRARAYLGKGRLEHGVGEPNEEYVRAYHDLNVHYQRIGDKTLAARERARLHLAMGLYQWVAEKNPSKALSEFRRAGALDDTWAEPHRRMGAMAASGLWSEDRRTALAALDVAVRLRHPDKAGIALDRGRILRLQGDYRGAATAFRAALSHRPGWTEAAKALKAVEGLLK